LETWNLKVIDKSTYKRWQ